LPQVAAVEPRPSIFSTGPDRSENTIGSPQLKQLPTSSKTAKLTGGRAAPSIGRQRSQKNFFPCRLRRHSSRNKKSPWLRPPLRCGPTGAIRSPAGKTLAIEAAVSRSKHRRKTMAHIGTFTKTSDGFIGDIHSIDIQQPAKIISIDKASDKAPEFRVIIPTKKYQTEAGAAWNKVSREGKSYISVKLDAPTFKEPVYAILSPQEDGSYHLIWNR
jgi:uncharacterized protein (DUF736 family)